MRIARALAAHVEARDFGIVLIEVGFKLESRPDTVRTPDVSFVARSRIPGGLSTGYWNGAPDLAVEVAFSEPMRSRVKRQI